MTNSSPPDDDQSAAALAGGDLLADWHALVLLVIQKLRGLAGTSENEFLQIGEQMQGGGTKIPSKYHRLPTSWSKPPQDRICG